MSDNLVCLLNKLSYQIVFGAFEEDKSFNPLMQDEKYFWKCVKKVRQKGCDVLLGKTPETKLHDPCLTDYGGNWSPIALISDYGKELMIQESDNNYELLFDSLKCLEEKDYSCLNELLKFLLILKESFFGSENSKQKAVSFGHSGFLKNSVDSLSGILKKPLPWLNDGFTKNLSFRKALQYKESWTTIFDSKFELLGKFSMKNLMTHEKLSFDSIFYASATKSHSNSFFFTDICANKYYQSERNLFNSSKSSYSSSSDSPLLDSFVETPINHKLPNLISDHKALSGSSYFIISNDMKKRVDLWKAEHFHSANNEVKGSVQDKETSIKSRNFQSCGIPLKRNANCSHSFAILYKKNKICGSQSSSLKNSGSSLYLIDKIKNDSEKRSRNSKEIILSLWEEDLALIKAMKPELADELPQLRMIHTSEFVDDIKFLLTGINTGTFQYNSKEDTFEMIYGTCLHDVTPESLFNFSKDFIKSGNCYVKLRTFATENGKSNLENCTTISQAFWKSIFDYLELHYSIVLSIPSTTNLMALKSATRSIFEMIEAMSYICKAFSNTALPEGGKLLTYLLEVLERVNKQCVKNIVFGILQNCCSVYIKCILQPWMFKGQIEKNTEEFFIEYGQQRTKVKNRIYYNSFSIINERIPNFLKGFEDNIMNCGKSIHFLKLFSPEDKFCQLLEKGDYPKMNLCVSDTGIQDLEEQFKKYKVKVTNECGQGISIRDLRNKEKEKERLFLEHIKIHKDKQLEERLLLKIRELEALKQKKDLQNQVLNEQISNVRKERKKRELEEWMEEKRARGKIQKLLEKENDILVDEKKLVEHYYSELLSILQKQIDEADTRRRDLLNLLESDEENENTNETITSVYNENITNLQSHGIEWDINLNPIISQVTILEAPAFQNLSIDTIASSRLISETTVSLDENSNSRNFVELRENDQRNNFCEKHEISEIISESSNDIAESNEFCSEKALTKESVSKSISLYNVATEEAKRNKLKVLKSEFGMRAEEILPQINVKYKSQRFTDLERNRRKVLESEYSILNAESDLIVMKPVTSTTEIAVQSAFNMHDPISIVNQSKGTVDITEVEAIVDFDQPQFHEILLKKKSKFIDLGKDVEEQQVEIKASIEDSFNSLLTLDSGNKLEEELVAIEPYNDLKENSNLLVIKNKYLNSLKRDANISLKKTINKELFSSLNDIEFEKFPCTDFMKFQRCLRKSCVIPLLIQEKLANDALLRHLLIGERLLSHLKSLRSFFFLSDGEFSRCFTQNTFRSLAKCTEPQQFFERSNLSNIVNEALNHTIYNFDRNANNLSFQIVKMPPYLNHSSHEVLTPFELSYKIDWPLNIILTDKALNKYKTIFKFLLKLKRVNWSLNENFCIWNLYFKNPKFDQHVLVASPHYHKIQIYRHKMTQIVITLNDYIFSDGIQIPWMDFLQDLQNTENIDHLYQKHIRYIKGVLMRCFLSKTDEDLLYSIHSLIELVLKFHYISKSSLLVKVEGNYEHPKFNILRNTYSEFCSVTKEFLHKLKEKIATNQALQSHYILIEKFDLKLT